MKVGPDHLFKNDNTEIFPVTKPMDPRKWLALKPVGLICREDDEDVISFKKKNP